MTENVEKSKASKRPIRENSPMARAMAAAARAAIFGRLVLLPAAL